MNSYTDHLNNAGDFPLKYGTVGSQMRSIYSGASGIQKARHNATRVSKWQKSGLYSFRLKTSGGSSWSKRLEHSYSPMHGTSVLDLSGEIEAQPPFASKLYPECPVRWHSEADYQLLKKVRYSTFEFSLFWYSWRTLPKGSICHCLWYGQGPRMIMGRPTYM